MARYTLVIAGLILLVGCQANSLVENLPAPNFNAPDVAPQQRSAVALAPTPPPVQQPRTQAIRPLGSERDWIPTAPTRQWRWIVIHHSATPSGSAAVFDKMHKAKGWDELGYHFVIGNGTDSGNGQIEVGSRWPKQKWGAHAKTPDNQYNDYGIGICLVGNFDIEQPTQQQMQSLAKIVSYMMKTYHIPASRVIGHRDTKSTDCPGKNMNLAQVRSMASRMLADAGESIAEDDVQTAGETLQAAVPTGEMISTLEP
jgi:hypothetical protein